MQMAIDVAGFTPAESDELRQAMGSKRSAARMERLRERLYAGMAERGITGDIADELFVKMKAFANYGFPESHSVSLRLPRLRLVVDQVPRAGGVLRGAAQRPADGLLVAAHAGAGRPPPRRRRAHPRPQRLAAPAPRSNRATRVRAADGRVRLGHRTSVRRRSAGASSGRATIERGRGVEPTGRSPTHRGPRAAGAGADARAARGDGDRRAVRRVLRARPARGAVDGRCRRPVAARPAGRASSPVPTRRTCPA